MRKVLFYAVLAGFTFFSVFPFVFSILTSFKQADKAFDPGLLPNPWTLENYTAIIHGTPLFMTWVVNSLLIAVVSVVILVLLSLMGGYALARIPFMGREAVFTIMLPP
jgi:ABC-type glycerol-3-phosphate transport system permease component